MLTFDKSQFETIDTKSKLNQWVRRIEKSKEFCADTETTGLDIFNDSLVGFALAVEDEGRVDASYIPLAHHTGRNLDVGTVLTALAPALADRKKGKVFHNAAYDLGILSQPRYGITIENIHDPMYMTYALYGDSLLGLGVDYLSKRFLNYDTIAFNQVVTDVPGRDDFRDVPIPEATTYATEDTAVTLVLAKVFQHMLRSEGLWELYNEDRKLILVLHAMKRTGAKVDVKLLSKLDREWGKEQDELQRQAYSLSKRHFSLGSPTQVLDVLKDRGLQIPVDRKTRKQSVDRDTLENLPHDELVDVILAWRGKSKLRSTYAVALPKKISQHSGRVHGNFNFTRTSTGRGASSKPNLQNIPTRTEDGAKLRAAFITDPNWSLLSADYSQIEYRILAHITQDPYLIQCFRDGVDLHARMAADVRGGDWREYADKKNKPLYKIRGGFKNVNFAVIYGAGPAKVARMSGIELDEAHRILDAHQELAPRVYTWKEDALADARRHLYSETLFGRRIHVPHILSSKGDHRGHAERLAINGIVQGSAADLMRRAMVRVYDDLQHLRGNFCRILMTVHDELVLECSSSGVKEIMPIVKTGMETCVDHLIEWRVPIIAEIDAGKTWKDAK